MYWTFALPQYFCGSNVGVSTKTQAGTSALCLPSHILLYTTLPDPAQKKRVSIPLEFQRAGKQYIGVFLNTTAVVLDT